MNKTPLWILLVLALALTAGLVYKAWPLLFPEVRLVAQPDPKCDLRAGPCISRLGTGAEISFGIEPRAIPMLEPLRLSVAIKGLEATAVEVDFEGLEMYMGFNRPKLIAQADGHFNGETRLPVCVRDAMEWEARVLLHTAQGILAVPFRFITIKSGALPE